MLCGYLGVSGLTTILHFHILISVVGDDNWDVTCRLHGLQA
jgi:hypothetical protein